MSERIENRWSLLSGEVSNVLARFPPNTFDALLCDPPYGLSFMGKAWDYDVPSTDLWRECLRVLKPGAPLLSFGGSRTFHRIACNLEDAGFELRDCLMWLYGKGFPKSLNVGLAIDKAAGATRPVVGSRVLTGNAAVSLSDKGGTYGVQVGSAGNVTVPVTAPSTDLAKQWNGYGTALKPAWEPVILARKPLEGTVAENVAKWGTGGLAIDACRISGEGAGTHCSNRDASGRCRGHRNAGRSTSGETFHGPEAAVDGRWPANLILDEDAAALLDLEAGDRPSTPFRENTAAGNVLPLQRRTAGGYSDSGGPSRFFYTSKVSTKEREAGCEGLPRKTAGEMTDSNEDDERLSSPRTGAGRTGGARNHHPTLKPISLTTWLATLIKPPAGGLLLVPFAGSGSEMIGGLRAGWNVVGIEREAEYVTIARARIPHWCQGAIWIDAA